MVENLYSVDETFFVPSFLKIVNSTMTFQSCNGYGSFMILNMLINIKRQTAPLAIWQVLKISESRDTLICINRKYDYTNSVIDILKHKVYARCVIHSLAAVFLFLVC